MSFSKSQIVKDSLGRTGIVLEIFKTDFGIFYSVLIDGIIHEIPEEELSLKDE